MPDRFWHAEARPARLRVTGDGFLAQLPFAPLNLGTAADYQPLVVTTDVIWHRHGLKQVLASGIETVVAVADPVLDVALCRRFSLADHLPGARAELQRVVGAIPVREVLVGKDATSDRMAGIWDTVDRRTRRDPALAHALNWTIPTTPDQGAATNPVAARQNSAKRAT